MLLSWVEKLPAILTVTLIEFYSEEDKIALLEYGNGQNERLAISRAG
jgi:hypothetical protein